jgi:hypothetical protein
VITPYIAKIMRNRRIGKFTGNLGRVPFGFVLAVLFITFFLVRIAAFGVDSLFFVKG